MARESSFGERQVAGDESPVGFRPSRLIRPHSLTAAALTFELTVEPWLRGKRIDTFLIRQFPNYSRCAMQRMIAAGTVSIEGKTAALEDRVYRGQHVVVQLTQLPDDAPCAVLPGPWGEGQNRGLAILYEDEYLLAINKLAGQIVHPAGPEMDGTLLNVLQGYLDRQTPWPGLQRPGLVHRLDRDTSGVLLVAKGAGAHRHLSRQFQQRRVEKEYLALVEGVVTQDRGEIDRPIGRDPDQPSRMAVASPTATGKAALTVFEALERFETLTWVRAYPRTGRLHQVRVHLASIGHPVAADRVYGSARPPPPPLRRQALHAHRLKLRHPASGAPLCFEAPLAADLQQALESLRSHR